MQGSNYYVSDITCAKQRLKIIKVASFPDHFKILAYRWQLGEPGYQQNKMAMMFLCISEVNEDYLHL